MTIRVRAEQPADRDAIRNVVTAAFGRAAEADLIDQLRSDGDSVFSLVAADAAEIVGHALLSRVTAPFPALGLAPVSVIPERQRQGIGSRLIRAGLERAAQDGWKGVFVLGEPAFYRRFGFDPALARGFRSPYASPYLMALVFGDAHPVTSGQIEYAPAFRRFE